VQGAGDFGRAGGETVQFFQRDFSVVERAENQAAAVGTKVTGEIMCGHKEIRRHLTRWRRGVKIFSLNHRPNLDRNPLCPTD